MKNTGSQCIEISSFRPQGRGTHRRQDTLVKYSRLLLCRHYKSETFPVSSSMNALLCNRLLLLGRGKKKSSNSFDGEYSAKAADTTNCGLHLHDDNSTFRLIRPRKKLPKLARLHHGVPFPKNKTHLQQKKRKSNTQNVRYTENVVNTHRKMSIFLKK